MANCSHRRLAAHVISELGLDQDICRAHHGSKRRAELRKLPVANTELAHASKSYIDYSLALLADAWPTMPRRRREPGLCVVDGRAVPVETGQPRRVLPDLR
jgi:hypothetical protein